VCVGVHLAKSTLWITAAMMLSVFEFAKSKDEDGKEIDIAVQSTDGLAR
jgi:hypothetical protein